MTRFRLLLLCCLIWTVPLQGFAAVSMLFCGGNTSLTRQGDMSAAAHTASEHHHAAQAQAKPSTHQHTSPNADHKCGVCAACCSVVAISSVPFVPAVVALPSITLEEPVSAAYTVSPRHPERPPRV